jgi:phosphatidylglycerophosphatase A
MISVPLSLGLNRITMSNFLFATMLLIGSIAGAVWLCSRLTDMLKKDAQFVVIDEIVGFLLAISLLRSANCAFFGVLHYSVLSTSARFSQQTNWNSYRAAPALCWMM